MKNKFLSNRDYYRLAGMAGHRPINDQYADRLVQKLIKRKAKQKRRNERRRLVPRVTSDAFLESFEWRKLRMSILVRYGGRCMACGRSARDGIIICVDHIKPRKTHPHLALDADNLQILCHECNHGKGNWNSTDWRK